MSSKKTTKERLVNLLDEASKIAGQTVHKTIRSFVKENHHFSSKDDSDKVPSLHEIVADYLLSHGVILPPCKVGDTVYVMWKTCDIDEFIVSGYHISHTKDGEKTNSREYFECKAVRNPKISLALNVSELGKTVFLTREEAEAAKPIKRAPQSWCYVEEASE